MPQKPKATGGPARARVWAAAIVRAVRGLGDIAVGIELDLRES